MDNWSVGFMNSGASLLLLVSKLLCGIDFIPSTASPQAEICSVDAGKSIVFKFCKGDSENCRCQGQNHSFICDLLHIALSQNERLAVKALSINNFECT
jgi:hypothetical protein